MSQQELECLNCASRNPNPRIQLARTLERAWLKTVNSRLAVPFLRPLLPLSDLPLPDTSAPAEEEGYWTTEPDAPVPPALAITLLARAAETAGAKLTSSPNKRSHSAMQVDTTATAESYATANGAAGRKKGRLGRSSPRSRSSDSVDRLADPSPVLATESSAPAPVPSVPVPAAASTVIRATTEKLPGGFEADLLGVLDKIHALQYASTEQYAADLSRIRCLIEQKILWHSSSAQQQAASGKGLDTHSLLMAWDTIVEAGTALLASRALATVKIEQKISAAASPERAVGAVGTQLSALARGEFNSSRVAAVGCNGTSGHTETSAPNTAGTKLSCAALMQALWRVECTTPTPFVRVATVCGWPCPTSGASTTQSKGSADAASTTPAVCVPGRSLAGWTVFVEAGVVPAEFRGPTDPYSMQGVLQRAERNAARPARARDAVRAMLDDQTAGNGAMTHDMQVCENWLGACDQRMLFAFRISSKLGAGERSHVFRFSCYRLRTCKLHSGWRVCATQRCARTSLYWKAPKTWSQRAVASPRTSRAAAALAVVQRGSMRRQCRTCCYETTRW
jgi:hypothetical protein